MTESGYTDIPAVIRVLDGMKLSASKQTEGAVRALLRNAQTNSLETHAEIFLVDKSKSALKNLTPKDWAVLGIGTLVVIGATVATVKVMDRFKAGRPEKAEAIKTDGSHGIELHEPSEELSPVEAPVALVIGSEVETADEQVFITMTAEDWQELLRKAVLLNSLEERIWLLLSSVRIEGADEDVLEWQQRMKELSPQAAASEVRLMLEAHPELRYDEELADLIRMFIDGRPDDGDARLRSLGAE
ncbi:hypothetical protein [Agromyces mariniharenae]|uniref:Uncharacterized protein n=1 Tax=Agromyces mariniharenae TaxID=2604423 RepID=A0A5S4UU17_9MICO|nr:hypothetical protein [Agromyces mariniharenae]TYL50437.1 hypothetical protein FYC51_14615 [Agromyces mariniharenae]